MASMMVVVVVTLLNNNCRDHTRVSFNEIQFLEVISAPSRRWHSRPSKTTCDFDLGNCSLFNRKNKKCISQLCKTPLTGFGVFV